LHVTQDGKRLMEVSSDGGQVWNEVQLPAITMDRVSVGGACVMTVSGAIGRISKLCWGVM